MTANTTTTDDSSWSLYPYTPVKALPVLFALGFFACGSLMMHQYLTRYALKRYTFTMVFTCVVWIAGFILRMVSIYKDQNIHIFIAQYVLLFLGPPLFAGAEYFILGRVLAYLPYHSPIHPGRVLSSFIIVDAVVEILAVNGATGNASATTVADRNKGLDRMAASLVLQAILEVFFFCSVGFVVWKCKKAKMFPRNLRIVCYILYVTSAMMFVRCIFRIVEGFEIMDCPLDRPNCGSVDQHEWFFYVFEVANIFLFVLLLTIFPPGKYLPPNDKVYLDPIDGTERVGPGYAKADPRPFWRTVADPCNIHRVITGSGLAVDTFWEREHPLYRRNEPDQELPEITEDGPDKQRKR